MNLIDLLVFLYFGFTLCSVPIFLLIPKMFKKHEVTIYEKLKEDV